jgi:hypothetical protein
MATSTMTLKADCLCNHTIKPHHCCMLIASQASKTLAAQHVSSSSPSPVLCLDVADGQQQLILLRRQRLAASKHSRTQDVRMCDLAA